MRGRDERYAAVKMLSVCTVLWRLFASSCLPVLQFVRLPVCMAKVGSHLKDFHKIWYLSNF
jgi:hypothetical protein